MFILTIGGTRGHFNEHWTQMYLAEYRQKAKYNMSESIFLYIKQKHLKHKNTELLKGNVYIQPGQIEKT